MNYYQILGVSAASSNQEIKQQYRKLTLEFHSDKNSKDTTEKFKQISLAYEILGDSIKRQSYDNHQIEQGQEQERQRQRQEEERQRQRQEEERQRQRQEEEDSYQNSSNFDDFFGHDWSDW